MWIAIFFSSFSYCKSYNGDIRKFFKSKRVEKVAYFIIYDKEDPENEGIDSADDFSASFKSFIVDFFTYEGYDCPSNRGLAYLEGW